MTGLKRSSRLPAESAKRKAERSARTAVREAALRQAGYRCVAADIVPEIDCDRRILDVDERKSRGVNPGGHLDVANTQVLCRAHHRWRTEHPTEAWERGLRVKSWENDSRTVDEPVASFPETGEQPVQLVVHIPRPGVTVDWMCKGIMIEGHWVHSAAELIEEVGLDIPAELLAQACAADPAIDGPDAEPFPPDTCFCCVDALAILDGLGRTYHVDECGDLVVTG